MQTVNQKLKALRIKWKNHPELRSVIERQAKALLYSKKPYKIPSKEKHENRVFEVIDKLV
jgi:hypothetical protein